MTLGELTDVTMDRPKVPLLHVSASTRSEMNEMDSPLPALASGMVNNTLVLIQRTMRVERHLAAHTGILLLQTLLLVAILVVVVVGVFK